MRILLVEDDTDAASGIAELLMRNGHDVVLSDDLYCLDLIKQQGRVDMVITGIFLRRRSGLQIVLDVKDFDASIKVIAMSNGGNSHNFDYLDYAMEFGADAVIRKPVEEHSVLRLVEGVGTRPGGSLGGGGGMPIGGLEPAP